MATTTAPRFARVSLPNLTQVATEQINATFAEMMRRAGGQYLFTFIDLLCGGGGSSAGLTLAGGQLVFGANHAKVAIATHERNFPDARHECVDLNHYDMRNLPSGVDVLWASVICTESSPAGGRKRSRQSPGQLALLEYGEIEQETFERTRATAQDVVRAAELHQFPIICVENVLEFATDWKLFPWWLSAFPIIGYRRPIIVSASSAHFGVDGILPPPQWRNRIYIIFVREDLPELDIEWEPRPPAWCNTCAEVVGAIKLWKDPRGLLTKYGERFLIGKYGEDNGQYVYGCPVRGHGQVEPYVRAAAEIIDWDHLGELIGDRRRPLVPNTMARLRRGIDMAARGELSPAFLDANGGSWNTGPASVWDPFRTRTASDWEALCVPPGTFIDTMRRNALPRSPFEPMTTLAAGGNHHGLVVPYYTKGVPSSAAAPFPTMTTRDRFGLLTGDDFRDVNNWRYRMTSWVENALAQGFPDGYEVAGNDGERKAQVGNAVSVQAAQFFGMRFAHLLAGRAVAA